MQKSDGTPIQRSLVREFASKADHLYAPQKGIVLEVRNADDQKNRAAMQSGDFRGFIAEATVWLIDAGVSLDHVLITPNMPTGLDSFHEFLPRAAKFTVTGQPFSLNNLTGIDPADLDGDWCIVSFLNGKLHTPFISNWWPNPRNYFDAATSGKGNPSFKTSKGTALDQRGRFFQRINGVEQVITRDGDIWISTARGGDKIVPQQPVSIDGRVPRLPTGSGGSILVNVKPGQTFRMSFDPQVDGVGPSMSPDDSIPQKNPQVVSPLPNPIVSTNISADTTGVKVQVPLNYIVDAKVGIQQSAQVIREAATTMLQAEAPLIRLGDSAVSYIALANGVLTALNRLEQTVAALVIAYNSHGHAALALTPPSPAMLPTTLYPDLVVPSTLIELASTKVISE